MEVVMEGEIPEDKVYHPDHLPKAKSIMDILDCSYKELEKDPRYRWLLTQISKDPAYVSSVMDTMTINDSLYRELKRLGLKYTLCIQRGEWEEFESIHYGPGHTIRHGKKVWRFK